MRVTLTAEMVRKAKPGPSRVYLWDEAVSGLGLIIHPSGRRSWVFQGGPSSGRRITIRAASLSQARTAALALRGGLVPPVLDTSAPGGLAAPLTVDALLDSWLTWLAERPNPPHTLPRIRACMANHVRPRLGPVVFQSLTRAQVLAVRDALVATGRRGMANQVMAYFRAAMRWAEDAQVIPEAPRWRLPRLRLGTRAHALTDEQWQRLLCVLRDPQVGLHRVGRLALWALLITGCRKGEVAALRWTEVGTDGTLTLVRHKTSLRSGPKTVPGTPELRAVLDEVRRTVREVADQQPSVLMSHALRTTPFVFPSLARNGIGKPIGRVLDDVWTAVRSLAGLPTPMTIHGLRGAFITQAQRMGIPLATVAAMVGHESPMTTLRHYSSPTLGEITTNARMVSQWIMSRHDANVPGLPEAPRLARNLASTRSTR